MTDFLNRLKRLWSASQPLRRPFGVITPLGWIVLLGGAGSWALAAWFGWVEFAIIATALLTLFGLSLLFLIGRMRLAVSLELSPQRVNLGKPAMARFEVTNDTGRPLLGLGIELPVGVAVARYTTPVLRSGDAYDEWLTIDTSRRGVVQVGPVRTQRGDPFGLVRRQVAWTERLELFIHPRVVQLTALGTGLLRDLEGQTTQDVSDADLAFHALRDYAPGDDLRHIHWKSTAKLSAASGERRFMVRQFLDTRRSHVVVVTDARLEVYADENEWETALSVAASFAVRAVLDEAQVSVLVGESRAIRPLGYQALDAFSRAEHDEVSLSGQVAQTPRLAPDASLVVLVTGSARDFAQLQRSRSLLSANVRMLAVRVELGAQTSLRTTGQFSELTIGALSELPQAVGGGVAV
jgi:uncharacterized protein (DUF58 family)